MEFSGALASAKAAYEVLKVVVDARGDASIKNATLELRERLFSMSDIAMAYIEKNALLTEELAALKLAQAQELQRKAELEHERRERENYVLHHLPGAGFVYASKPAVEGNEAVPHYLCQPCYDKGIKSVLRFVPQRTIARQTFLPHWDCPEVPTGHKMVQFK